MARRQCDDPPCHHPGRTSAEQPGPDVTGRLAAVLAGAAAGAFLVMPSAAADESPTPAGTTVAEPTAPALPTTPPLTAPAPSTSPLPVSTPPPVPVATAAPTRRPAEPSRASRGTAARRRPDRSAAVSPAATYDPACGPCASPQPAPALLPAVAQVDMQDPVPAGSMIPVRPVEEVVGMDTASGSDGGVHLTAVPLPFATGGGLALFAAAGTILAAFRSRQRNGQVNGGAEV
jgi:hypothetical protein